MKKQTKKEVWYWLMIAVGILLIMTIWYGSKLSSNDVADDQPTQEQNQEEEIEDESDTQEPEEEDQEEAGVGGSSESEYNINQSGGQLGQSYLLSDVDLVGGESFDRLRIDLSPEKETTLPKWQSSQDGNIIDLSISDTSNFDIVTGQKTYTGESTLSGSNNIRKVTIDSSSGEQVLIKIELDNKRPYQVVKETNPLRLIIKVY